MTTPSNPAHHEVNANGLYCLLRPRSMMSSSESGSFESIKSSMPLSHHSSSLGNADTAALQTPAEIYGADSTTPSALHVPFPPLANDAMSEASFPAFGSAADESKNRFNFEQYKLLDGPPTAITPLYAAFKPTVDKSLLEPQHPISLDGYAQVQSHPKFATLADQPSSQKYYGLMPTDRISVHSPPAHNPTDLTRRNTLNIRESLPGLRPPSVSSSGSFFTPPESPRSSSDVSFETALTTIKPGLDFHKRSDKNSANMLATHHHPTNGNIYERLSLTTSNNPNSIPIGDAAPRLPRHRRTLSNGKTNIFDPQSPQKSASFYLRHSRPEAPPPFRGPVHDGSLLTLAIQGAVSKTIALFETMQENRISIPGASSNPFSHQSPETLAYQYAITVDAKNALTLRQSAVIADIGLYLELLIPKINVYAMDAVKLISVHQDLDYIHQECVSQHFKLQFSDLEWQRSESHPCGLAFIHNKRHQEFSWQKKMLEFNGYSDAQAVGLQFLNDPAAVIENRLPALRSQR